MTLRLRGFDEFVRELGEPDFVVSLEKLREQRARVAALAPTAPAIHFLAAPERVRQGHWSLDGGVFSLVVREER